MADTHDIRNDLGDYNSIVCFRAVVTGMEEALGKRAATIALKAAGRKRGHDLVESLGLTGAAPEQGEELAEKMDLALGKRGTRLCGVDRITRDGGEYQVYLSDTVCSADEPQGSDRELSFTFGAIHGALEAMYGVKLRGKQTGSVLRGADHDVLEFHARD